MDTLCQSTCAMSVFQTAAVAVVDNSYFLSASLARRFTFFGFFLSKQILKMPQIQEKSPLLHRSRRQRKWNRNFEIAQQSHKLKMVAIRSKSVQ